MPGGWGFGPSHDRVAKAPTVYYLGNEGMDPYGDRDMTNIRHLATCVDIAALACQAGRATTTLECVRIVRTTAWGKAVPVAELKRAIESRLLVGAVTGV
jgi:hypothetical protein